MPALLFDWNHAALELAVAQVQVVPAYVMLPAWIVAPNAAAITADSLKRDIIRVLAVHSGGSAGSSILAPNSLHQYRDVTCMIHNISMDPFLQYCVSFLHAGVFLATLYEIEDGKKAAVPRLTNIMAPSDGSRTVFQ
jgi:hypothetical protein